MSERASEREGGEQHCRHSPTVTAPQPEDRGSNGNSGSGRDGGGTLCHPSAAQSLIPTVSLWDHLAELGAKGEKKKERRKLLSVLHKTNYWTSTPTGLITHTHLIIFPSLTLTYTHTLTLCTEPHFSLPFGLVCLLFLLLLFFFPYTAFADLLS